MQHLAFRAYGEVQQRTAGPKEIELSLFRQITEALEAVAAVETPPLEAWADALYRNQQLWTIVATDLVNPDNTLPEETKRNLVSLSQFVRQCSNRVLAGNDGIADLIDINKSIIAGLSGIPVSTVTEEAA
ncbi:flagellar biosynthesis regulator FlaF [Hyphomonas oceanitis]|uniref:flagellar biosynthesis regulator FlaF n=1 Tax=Hyphomonas oceanitis TaxID=81033 RepID=UPI000A005110|nr:flagellar biosynthesis regulator FlaF [Hyphomonas oceanitis]